jgi:hypothetical protein
MIGKSILCTLQMTKVVESGILKTKNFERMSNDLERHLQVRNIKHQTQFDKLSAIARKFSNL